MIDTQIERTMDTNTQTPIWSLALLTVDEATTLYEIAFGRLDSPIETWKHPDEQYRFTVEITSEEYGLIIGLNGTMMAWANLENDRLPVFFNARKVLIYLALLGIHFDEA